MSHLAYKNYLDVKDQQEFIIHRVLFRDMEKEYIFRFWQPKGNFTVGWDSCSQLTDMITTFHTGIFLLNIVLSHCSTGARIVYSIQ